MTFNDPAAGLSAQAARRPSDQRGDARAHDAVGQGHAFRGTDRGGDEAHLVDPFGNGRKALTRCW